MIRIRMAENAGSGSAWQKMQDPDPRTAFAQCVSETYLKHWKISVTIAFPERYFEGPRSGLHWFHHLDPDPLGAEKLDPNPQTNERRSISKNS